jgi:monoamine oxidase
VPDLMYPWVDHSVPFDARSLYARPNFIPLDQHELRQRVCIIGGGIAGLTAAFELRELGHHPLVLEAEDRLGGRIRTARFADGAYAELGAMRIPVDHVGVFEYMQLFSLGTPRLFVHVNGQAFLKFRGSAATRVRNFEQVLPNYPNLRMRYQILPTEGFGRLTNNAAAGVPDAAMWDLFEGNLSDPTLEELEEITLRQFLQGVRGLRPQLLNSDEWEWIGRGTGTYWLEAASALEHVIEGRALLAAQKYEIPGGMDRLVHAFSDRLQGSIRLRSEVAALRPTPLGVEVTWRDQFGWQHDEFHSVIAAVPPAAMLRIDAPPDLLPARLREALSGVRYESLAKTVVHCRRRVWEVNDRIAGGGSFTDLPIQQCWYPSDNAVDVSQQDEDSMEPDDASGTRSAMWPSGGAPSIAPTSWGPNAAHVSNGPGALVGAYMWGANALRFADLSSRERDRLVAGNLELLHRGISDEIVEMEHMCWDLEGGSVAFFRPGEFSRYQRTLCAPCPYVGKPRLFFAGEHLGVLHAWIQSSMVTAWAAVAKALA